MILSSVGFLSACNTLQDVNQPAPTHLDAFGIPEQWATVESEKISYTSGKLEWISQDEIPELQQFISEALQNNPDLKAAKARVDSAKAQTGIAKAPTLPNVSTSFSATRQRSPGPSGGVSSSQFELGANLNWELDLWGRVSAGYKASASTLLATQLDYQSAVLSTATRTAEAWLALINAKEQRQLSEMTVAALDRLVVISRRRFERGTGTILDLRLAERDMASGQADLELQYVNEKNTARALEVLLGRYPAGTVQAHTDFPELAPLNNLVAPSNILNDRPDVKAAYRRLQAATYRLEESQAAQLPILNLRASANVSNNSLANLLDANRLVASIVGSITQPLFDGGQRRQQVRLNAASLDEQSASYLSTVIAAFNQTEQLLTDTYHQTKRQELLALSLLRAQESEELSIRQYNAGLTTLSDLLQAQRTRFTAQSQLIALRHERLRTRANLHLALGGQTIPEKITNFTECTTC